MEQKLTTNQLDGYYKDALDLLKNLIQIPSFSGEEEGTAQLIGNFLKEKGIQFHRKHNNIWAKNKHFDPAKPSLLLNSHHDTVKPNKGYTNDPFEAFEKDGKLYGLGSNDAGGALVSLITAFLHFYDQTDLNYNILLAATGEEENTGEKGVASVLPELGELEFALVGEPTEMELAVAEKALLVIDCTAKGTPSHAAHPNDDNAIYKALEDLLWVKNYEFPKISNWLGKVKMTVTVIHAGEQHNSVPSECRFTIDVRVTDQYSTQEVYDTIKAHLKSETKARSLKRDSSAIDPKHPLVKRGVALGRKCYGSPTSSDQAVIPFPSLKVGPGRSQRSHSADEFIYLSEIKEGIDLYIRLLQGIL